MATILRLNYSPEEHLTRREKARAILGQGGNDEPITITDPALMREIALVNMEEYECKLSVEYRVGENVRHSHGYTISDDFDSILSNAGGVIACLREDCLRMARALGIEEQYKCLMPDDNLTGEQFAKAVEAECSPAAKRIEQLEQKNARLRDALKSLYELSASAAEYGLSDTASKLDLWFRGHKDLFLPNAETTDPACEPIEHLNDLRK